MGKASSRASLMWLVSGTPAPSQLAPLCSVHLRNIYVLLTVGRQKRSAMVRNLDHLPNLAMVQSLACVNDSFRAGAWARLF